MAVILGYRLDVQRGNSCTQRHCNLAFGAVVDFDENSLSWSSFSKMQRGRYSVGEGMLPFLLLGLLGKHFCGVPIGDIDFGMVEMSKNCYSYFSVLRSDPDPDSGTDDMLVRW